MQNPRHFHTLELDRVLEQLAACTSCDESRSRALAVSPRHELASVTRALALTVAANNLSNRFGYPTIYKMTNCGVALRRANKGSSLTLRELLDVALILRTMRSLSIWKEQADETETSLDLLFEGLYRDPALEARLNNAIVSEDELDDNASAELSDIRRKIRSAGMRVRSQLDGMIRSPTWQKYLQEPIVTIRDGRFVVPVKTEYRNEVKGLIHDTSSSGATFFIEPMGVVELNNEIRTLEAKEKQEIDRIIAELSALVGDVAEPIEAGYDAAVELDLCFSKSRMADRMRATMPRLTDSGETTLKKARHPMLPDERAVPIDISVGGGYDTLVITGPNTGGKTVAIKTLGLLTLMAMCGLMIPAGDGSVVSVYQQVLSDIGDEQSIEQSLSTFSSHMTNIISILAEAEESSLVLLDELGAGTDPVEGAALAIAIIEALRDRGAKVAATTHYPEIKLYALETDGVENASCEFDVASLRPTYRLLTGIPGRSNAFLISERLGLDTKVIARAKECVSTENTRFEDVVGELDAARQSLENEQTTAQKLRREAEQFREEMAVARQKQEQEAEREIERARVKARRIIEETRLQAEIMFEDLERIKKEQDAQKLSERIASARQSYRGAMREMEELSDPVRMQTGESYVLPRALEKGDIVFVRTLGKEGLVLQKPSGNSVRVQAGILKTTVPLTDVTLGHGPGKKNQKQQPMRGLVSTKGIATRSSREIKTELDLRGQDAEQAVLELNQFIDGAILSGVKTICIIHGKGTGVLRAAVARRLRSNPAIATFRLGHYGEGEDGVTIAELK